MKVAIIGGTGDQGFGLALRFAKAGEKVLLGSRDIKKAENTVNIIHNMLKGEQLECIQGMTNQEAAQKGDLLILTVPLQAQKVTLQSIKDHLEGKILVDATVPLETCIGGSSTRYVDLWEGSAAERTAEFLKEKEISIVSAFNNISSSSLTNIKEDVKCDCLVSGDDVESKNKVMELAEKIPGVRAIDCGPLENARIVEKITPLLIALNIKNKTRLAGLRITGL
ncbi:MAG: NADPH-dependent F420 reductase [Euryarchaeota archaeon]|nr:NADPH-dependent F420 reductase [Euryarchaeota archaeon]MBV1730575.1 NADPH-dependent F420 reductase [Methanobacterium sp.]MBU4547895.1 NADPH-dependent F420 reductase [Euryarchaeota archaeon]MBU4608374.1 NADPH-dependent F420 reductase [Euryarchaeota archaeon]MBV1754254.1 NADPH-dependent F420 reductase [Methanobacterium sp.]